MAEKSDTKSHVVRWQTDTVREGSRWFRRFYKEAKRMSPHFRFKRIKYGFYRIYYKGAYMHEAYKEMPMLGYDWDDADITLAEGSRKYFQEYEDRVALTRRIKNFKEGYIDATDRLKTRLYMIRRDREFYKNAYEAYKTMKIH